MAGFGEEVIEFEMEKGVSLRKVASSIASLARELELPVLVAFDGMTFEIEPGATVADIMGGYAAAKAQKHLTGTKKKKKKT